MGKGFDTDGSTDILLNNRRQQVVGPQEKVKFHPEQLKELEKIFSRTVLGPNSTVGEMHHYFGQQSILEFIRGRTRM